MRQHFHVELDTRDSTEPQAIDSKDLAVLLADELDPKHVVSVSVWQLPMPQPVTAQPTEED